MMRRLAPVARAAALACLLAAPSRAAEKPRVVVDDFENPALWQAQPAAGVELAIGSDAGVHGKALRLDVNFTRGSGYAVAHRAVSLDLPANYRFHFAVRGAIPPEDLEFKLIDSTGTNVWWMNRRGFAYPTAWDSLITRKRQVEFAWGPAGGGELHHISAIEIAITAGKGGRGTVWLDDMTLEELPPADAAPPPVVRHVTKEGEVVDFGVDRELSGIALDWPATAGPPGQLALERSDDGTRWTLVRHVLRSPNRHNEIHMPETATRFLRLRADGPGWDGDVAHRVPPSLGGEALTVHPWDWAPTGNAFFAQLAKTAPRGAYPRAFLGEQPYWTILGDDPGNEESLFDEDGRIEPWKGGPSIEPFFVVPGAPTSTWTAAHTSGLGSDELPLATLRRTMGSATLAVSAFVQGADSAACLHARYEVTAGTAPVQGTLVLAIRPFQVNSPAQFLNGTGGACTVRKIDLEAGTVRVDRFPPIRPASPVDLFSPGGFDEFDVGQDPAGPLARDGEHGGSRVTGIDDSAGYATARLSYAIDLPRGKSRSIDLEIPLVTAAAPSVRYDEALRRALASWKSHGRLASHVQLPGAGVDVIRTLDAQLTWARVTKDGPVLKPGARAYDRAWIRDGALSADAFLRAGQPQVAKDFAEWFAPFVADDGAVPCCVDARGPDPTPEHDSHGEFIFLVAEIVRYTGDVALAERLWPAVRRAALHIDTLREQRRTAEWRTPANAPYFGLLPPSISHEGYSARPEHSYWDDLWALRGLRDATDLARRLGHAAEARSFAASRDTFTADLSHSVRAAMAAHAIDYVPGCADLGDFDATSTTIALDPVEAQSVLPPGALERTFEGYWSFFLARRDSGQAWDAYTPYELRIVGAMARLGWRDRAAQALAWFMKGLSPAGFLTWPEVVDHDPRHERFIGDMPHTWVGTDGVRAGLDLVAFVSGPDSALVLGAGIPVSWLKLPVTVRDLPKPFGPLSYTMSMGARSLDVRVRAGIRVPRGGVRAWPPAPAGRRWRAATVDGVPTRLAADGSVVVRRVPAVVHFLM